MAESGEGSPEYTAEQVEQFIASQVEKHKDEIIRGYEASRQQPAPQRQQSPNEREQQHELERHYVLNDIGIGRDLERLQFAISDGVDRATFYQQYPAMAEYRNEIETAFTEAAKNGRPTAREAIADWIQGREMRLNPDKYQERRAKMQKEAVHEVRDAIDVAAQAVGKTRQEYSSLQDFGKTDSNGKFVMSTADMEKALEGLAI